MFSSGCRPRLKTRVLKGELKAKISNFSNIVFGKPDLSKVKCVGLFLLKITFEVGLFPLLGWCLLDNSLS